MANTASSPESVHSPAGSYSHAVAVSAGSKMIFVSGQVGMAPDGTIPASFADQADQAWSNVARILEHHGLGMADVVKTTHYLTDEANIAAYGAVRSRWLPDPPPASTLVAVSALARPGLLFEVEVIAAATD